MKANRGAPVFSSRALRAGSFKIGEIEIFASALRAGLLMEREVEFSSRALRAGLLMEAVFGFSRLALRAGFEKSASTLRVGSASLVTEGL